MPTIHKLLGHRIALLCAAVQCAFGALQQANANETLRIGSMPIEELKGVYLGCEQAASASRLNGDDVMFCSLVYEELKEKAFGGEFHRIKTWLDRQIMQLGLPRRVSGLRCELIESWKGNEVSIAPPCTNPLRGRAPWPEMA